jgi:hypothetical protein
MINYRMPELRRSQGKNADKTDIVHGTGIGWYKGEIKE